MDLGISGKTAIVAAASKGIGKAVAVGLAKCRNTKLIEHYPSLPSSHTRHAKKGPG